MNRAILLLNEQIALGMKIARLEIQATRTDSGTSLGLHKRDEHQKFFDTDAVAKLRQEDDVNLANARELFAENTKKLEALIFKS